MFKVTTCNCKVQLAHLHMKYWGITTIHELDPAQTIPGYNLLIQSNALCLSRDNRHGF